MTELKPRTYKGMSPQERVMSYVEPVTESGCWIWTGYVNEHGYGRLRVYGKKVLAHRAVWQFERGKIPEGKILCHTCDNTLCVNPNHLFIGTDKDNVADCIAKGRFRGWENSPWI